MSAEDRLVAVWRFEDEGVGILIQKVLEDEGIRSEIKSEQIPWMDGIMKAARGYWGELMVLEQEADRARTIIQSYLETAAREDQTEEGTSAGPA